LPSDFRHIKKEFPKEAAIFFYTSQEPVAI